MKRMQVFMVLLAVIAMACGGGSGKSPGEAYKEAIMSLADGKYDVVMSLTAPNPQGEEQTQDEKEKTMALLGMAHGQIVNKGGISEFNILDEQIAEDGTSAVVHFEVVFGDGETSEDKATMLKVDGKWKMQGF